jgi:hypothetical protein
MNNKNIQDLVGLVGAAGIVAQCGNAIFQPVTMKVDAIKLDCLKAVNKKH